MWQILFKTALSMLIKAIEGRVGKEVMEALQAGIVYAGSLTGSGEDKKAVALQSFKTQLDEAKNAFVDELKSGVPSIINLAIEALVARAKLG